MQHQKMPDIDEIADNLSDSFLKKIKKNSSDIDYSVLEKGLKTKYMEDGHSAMFLEGRKGIRIIVDHGTTKQESEINCKTEIKIFEKCDIEVISSTVGEKVYGYLIRPDEEFYKELEKISDTEWVNKAKAARSIPQDIVGEIEKTAANIGLSLKEILQLMAENAYVTQLRSKMK